MLSAIWFNLDQSKILSFGNGLNCLSFYTLQMTMPGQQEDLDVFF